MTRPVRLALIDHGAGNLVSIERALHRVGASVSIATDASGLADVDGVVLPGVGATGATMDRLRTAGLVDPLLDWDGPLLGICVGYQLFFDHSEEDDTRCLGLERGAVKRLRDAPKLPHIGWNDLRATADPLFAGLDADTTFYFVHSFAPVPDDASTVIATTTHGAPFAAAIRNGQRIGVQFHPERSGAAGHSVLANFVSEVAREPSPPVRI